MGTGSSRSPAHQLSHQMTMEDGSPVRPSKPRGNPFSALAQVMSFKHKKKAQFPPSQKSMHSPPPPAASSLPSFDPKDFAELAKTYKVDWTKTGELGKGHYATVYRGHTVVGGKPVAVKKVSKKLTRVDSLRTEVQTLRSLSGHPNIVELYDVFLDEQYMYLVLEMLAGGELFDRVVESGAYSERDAAHHMRKIGEALQFMHSKGIVHRDLKPENLVLSDSTMDSEIKISDFGLSKMLNDSEETMNTIVGTKAYAAPEVGFELRARGQAKTQDGYSSKVDMWSLGVILFVIVGAYHPFDPSGSDNDNVIWERIIRCEWSFNDSLWDTMSHELKDVIERLIELDPAKRLSADEFLKHPWLAMIETPVRPLPSLGRTRSSRYWKNGGGSFMLAAAAAAAVAEPPMAMSPTIEEESKDADKEVV